MPWKVPVSRHPESTLGEPFPKAVFRSVYEQLSALDYEVPSHETYAVPEGAEGLRDGAGILPEFMVGSDNDIPDLIRTGVLFPFDLEATLDEHAEVDQSDPHVTTRLVEGELGLEGAIEELHRRMKIELALENVQRSVDQNTDRSAAEIVAYALATYAKGWLVEAILAEEERFEKGDLSDDTDGKDLFDTLEDEWVQVKSVTSMASKSRSKLDAHSISYLYYQFDCAGHIVVGREPNEVNGVAADTKGISKTLIKRCHSSYKFDGRTYRYLWW
jgi:hypothetical protein